jgi:predicted nucleotidyltransferase
MKTIETASRLAKVVTSAGEGRVRRVSLIGSRARGDHRSDSDFDLAVIVEPDAASPAWQPGDVAAERQRLQRVVDRLCPSPPRVEIFVTTTDQFAVGRTIFGGVDWLIETEGVPLYAEPFRRQPSASRTHVQVRNGYAATWVQHALAALAAAQRGEPNATLITVERALVALLVMHQLPAAKAAGATGFARLLSARDPPFAEWMERVTARGITTATSRSVLKAVVDRISVDPAAAPYVAGVRRQLASAHPLAVYDPAVADALP